MGIDIAKMKGALAALDKKDPDSPTFNRGGLV